MRESLKDSKREIEMNDILSNSFVILVEKGKTVAASNFAQSLMYSHE
jgi:hypothetical protein